MNDKDTRELTKLYEAITPEGDQLTSSEEDRIRQKYQLFDPDKKIHSDRLKQEMESPPLLTSADLYQQMLDAKVQMGNHYSDLYVEKTPTSEAIIQNYQFKKNAKIFRNNIDGKFWYDIPFAYLPYWDKKHGSR